MAIHSAGWEDQYSDKELYCFSLVRSMRSRCLSLLMEQRPRCSLLPAEVAAAAELGRGSLLAPAGPSSSFPQQQPALPNCVLGEETLPIVDSEFSSCCSKVSCTGPSKESLEGSGHRVTLEHTRLAAGQSPAAAMLLRFWVMGLSCAGPGTGLQ